MESILSVLSLIVSVGFVYLVFKSKKLSKLKAFFKKIFWVDLFEGKSKTLLSFAMFFMICYLFSIPFLFINGIILLDLEQIIFVVFAAVVLPLMYRLVMLLQRFIHRI